MDYQLANQLVKGAQKSINRTLWVYSAIIVLFFSVIVVLWNLYLSWIKNLFLNIENLENLTTPQIELFRIWTSSTFFSIPMININLQISDASTIVSLAFFILIIWLFFSARRENHIIGKTLFLALNEGNEMKKFIYYGISFSNLFSTISERDDPISSLQYVESEKKVKYARGIIQFVFIAPTIAILSIIFLDLYSLFSLSSLFRKQSNVPLHELLTFWDFIKIAVMEFFAFGMAIACGFLGYKCWLFEKSTNKILKDFAVEKIEWEK